MRNVYKNRARGFTIVELLIVVVIIAILAAITIVAFNGATDRAHNSQTVEAVNAWVKALKMYKIDNGTYPTATAACLGAGYPYGISGQDSTGSQCRQDTSTSGSITDVPSFDTSVGSYFSNGTLPTPAFVTATTSGTYPYYRGAYFYPAYSTNPARIDFVVAGTTCPSIGGMTMGTPQSLVGGMRCFASFPD